MVFPDPAQSARIHRLSTELLICLGCALGLAGLFAGWSGSSTVMAVDRGFFRLAQAWSGQSWAVDTLIVTMFRTHTAKMVPLLACAIWLLFDRHRTGRSLSFFGHLLVGSFLAMAVARIMQNLSAHRPRPLHNPDLTYPLPHGIDASTLSGWSSFPSDTAALGFAIAAGLLLASRRLGVAAILWVAVVVAFPRAYAGLHYPSDLMGGALIGLGCTLGVAPLMARALAGRTRWTLTGRMMPWLAAVGFLYLFQMATMFDDLRAYGTFTATVLGR